jgi:hypothetical protein
MRRCGSENHSRLRFLQLVLCPPTVSGTPVVAFYKTVNKKLFMRNWPGFYSKVRLRGVSKTAIRNCEIPTNPASISSLKEQSVPDCTVEKRRSQLPRAESCYRVTIKLPTMHSSNGFDVLSAAGSYLDSHSASWEPFRCRLPKMRRGVFCADFDD